MKIRGNTVGTTTPRPDYNQDNENKADFIKNRPVPKPTAADEGKFLKVVGGKWVAVSFSELGAAPAYTYGTADIEAGSASTEPEGSLHFVYE